MRKSIISALIVLAGLITADIAQSLRRSVQTPDFFMPSDALQTTPHPERLPDVKMMQYQGRQAPVIEQLEQERIAQEQEKQVEEKRQTDLERYEKIKAKRAAETQKRLQEIKAKTARVISESVDKPLTKSEETPTNDENSFTELKVDESADIHTRILQEYAVDLNHISRGETVKNQRLEDMLADWTDEFHIVE